MQPIDYESNRGHNMFKLLNFLWWWEPTENEHANFEKKNWWKQISSSMNLGEDIYDGEGQNLKMRLSYFKDNLLKNTSYNRWGRLSIIYVLENIISLHSSGKHLNKFMYSALLHDYETDVKPTYIIRSKLALNEAYSVSSPLNLNLIIWRDWG